jgi:hypothetical protein
MSITLAVCLKRTKNKIQGRLMRQLKTKYKKIWFPSWGTSTTNTNMLIIYMYIQLK